MKKLELTSEQKASLMIVAESNGSASRRAKALLLFSEGWELAEVAKLSNVCVRTVERWLDRWLPQPDDESLADRPRNGRPKSINSSKINAIIKTKASDPSRSMRALEKEFEVSKSFIHQILSHANLSARPVKSGRKFETTFADYCLASGSYFWSPEEMSDFCNVRNFDISDIWNLQEDGILIYQNFEKRYILSFAVPDSAANWICTSVSQEPQNIDNLRAYFKAGVFKKKRKLLRLTKLLELMKQVKTCKHNGEVYVSKYSTKLCGQCF